MLGLAPSNHGTTVDGLTTLLEQIPGSSLLGGLLALVGAPAIPQQLVGSAFETHLFSGGDTVPGPRYVVIETTHDEIVTPYTNAFLSGSNVTNITIQNQCPTDPTEHIGLTEDSPALAERAQSAERAARSIVHGHLHRLRVGPLGASDRLRGDVRGPAGIAYSSSPRSANARSRLKYTTILWTWPPRMWKRRAPSVRTSLSLEAARSTAPDAMVECEHVF